MSQIENLPGMKWVMNHPRITAWIVLSIGMVVLLALEARDVGLLATQWLALIVATVLVAGACIWIVSWEDGDEDDDSPASKSTTTEPSKSATDSPAE